MGRKVLVDKYSRASVSHVRGGNLVVAAGGADGIYGHELIVINLTRIRCGAIVISGLVTRHGSEQGFGVTHGASKDLIIDDRGIASVAFGPAEMHNRSHATLRHRRGARRR